MRDHEMPSDIIYLSIVESGLDPKIKSKMGAVGLWQFMPATGRMYGMQANTDMDDRMDPEKSTVAAAKYLKSLYKMFGNWEVALAAYNCGPGNVRKAIRRSGGKTTFWGIYDHLPKKHGVMFLNFKRCFTCSTTWKNTTCIWRNQAILWNTSPLILIVHLTWNGWPTFLEFA